MHFVSFRFYWIEEGGNAGRATQTEEHETEMKCENKMANGHEDSGEAATTLIPAWQPTEMPSDSKRTVSLQAMPTEARISGEPYAAKLTFESGPFAGRVVALPDQLVTVGRAPDNDVVVHDPLVPTPTVALEDALVPEEGCCAPCPARLDMLRRLQRPEIRGLVFLMVASHVQGFAAGTFRRRRVRPDRGRALA